MTSTPDTKGAQPEQLVEEARRASFCDHRLDLIPDLITALYECREALRHYANEDHWSADVGKVYTTFTYDGGHSLPWKVALDALAAQPPSEASERSGTE